MDLLRGRAAALLAGGLAAVLVLGGCQPSRQDMRGVEAAEQLVRDSRPAGREDRDSFNRPAALVDGRPIEWAELRAGLAEAAGGMVLQEVILDQLLEREMRVRGVVIGPGAVERERALLVQAIAGEARATGNDAERLLEVVRRSRGLGTHRFSTLLERNARLRALVAGDVEVLREEVDREYLLRHGPRFRARVIMTPTKQGAAEARTRVLATEEGRALRFAEAAAEVSMDPSAERGGIVDPISPADPAYPASIREALEGLAVGAVSDVLAVDRGFAILLMEERIAGDGVEYPDVEAEIVEAVRRNEERVAMDALARRLLRGAEISIMDRGLEWSWRVE